MQRDSAREALSGQGQKAFGWFARITVGLQADAKAAVIALLDELKEGGKPGRPPDAGLVEKKKQYKPPAITYDDGKSVDPRRAARYLEDKLPERDRILVFDGGHALMVAVQTLTSSGADNCSTAADFGAVGQGLAIELMNLPTLNRSGAFGRRPRMSFRPA